MFTHVWTWIRDNSGDLGLFLSVIDLLLSILGFYVLWIQTKKIRSSSEAAAQATREALTAISTSDTISDLSGIRERIKKVQVAVRSNRYEIALHETQTLRESLHQIRTRQTFVDEQSQIAIQEMVTFLRKIQAHFEKQLAYSEYQVPRPAINQTLSDISTRVSEWMENTRYIGGDS